MAGLGRKTGLVSRREHGPSCPERGLVVAFVGAAENTGRMAGRGGFCRSPGGRRLGGPDRRTQELPFPAVLPARRLVLCPLRRRLPPAQPKFPGTPGPPGGPVVRAL